VFWSLMLAGIASVAQPIEVYVTTTDGEAYRGETNVDRLDMTTDFGSAVIRLDKVSQIHFGFPDVVLTTDGSELRGRVALGNLVLRTGEGTVTLFRSRLEMLAVMDDGVPRGIAGFEGVWSTTLGLMELVQTGLNVKGTYGPVGEFPLVGGVQGRRMTFGYSGSVSIGRGWFDLWENGNTFTGEYRVDGSAEPRPWAGHRLQPWRSDAIAGEVTEGQSESGLNYYLRVPAAYDGEKQFPALALFPGNGNTARTYVDTIVSTWPELAEDYILVGFEGERLDPTSTPGRRMFIPSYVNFSGHEVGPVWAHRQTPALIVEALEELDGFLPIQHWFVGGQSEGGFLTYAVLMFYPDQIAGAFAVSSDLLVQCDPDYFEDDMIRAAQQRIPLAIVHSQSDPTVPFGNGRNAFQRFQDGGFPMLRFFTDERGAHMFSRLPVEQAVRWLEDMNSSDPGGLMDFAERAYAAGRYRDAWAAADRVLGLGEAALGLGEATLEPRVAALRAEIDAKAKVIADRLAAAIAANRDGSWVDELWSFRAEFGLTPAAEGCLSAFARLREAQAERADQLFSEIQNEPDEAVRRSKLQEIVDDYYASKWYGLARWLLQGA
jgi:predicted esterase